MLNTKNQIGLAKLEFSYRPLAKPIVVDTALASSKFLAQICITPRPGHSKICYVLFLNAKHSVICWYCLKNTQKESTKGKTIAGLALACTANSVVIAHIQAEAPIRIKPINRLFMINCFLACENAGVDLFDYLICTPNSYFSFKESGYRTSNTAN